MLATTRLQSVPWICLCWILVPETGCQHSANRALTPGSEEEKTAQVTVWNERFEIFVEHRRVIAGRPTTFVTHLTDIEAFEPRREGPVKFIFRRGAGDLLEQVEPAPARPGIYMPELVIPAAGNWSIELRIPTEAGESVVILPVVTAYASSSDAARAPVPEALEGITFLKE